MTDTEWVVHPNRFETGPDTPGRNGHHRTLRRAAAPIITSTHQARVKLPKSLAHLAEKDGWLTFGGDDWWFIVGAARSFAREHLDLQPPPPFGFSDGNQWWWWDNTTTQDSILDTLMAGQYVQEYLERLFPNCAVTVAQPQQ